MTEVLLQVLAGLCLGGGSVVMVCGSAGLLRFPDFYTRMHAAGVTDTLGVVLIALGLMLPDLISLNTLKLLLIIIFVWITSPTATHALAKAARHAGLHPFSGRTHGSDYDATH